MTSYWHAYVDLIEQPGGWWLALLPIVIGLCLWCLAVQVGLTRLLRRRSAIPNEYSAIPVIVHPYVVTLAGSGRKGFEHRATVVSLAERRRNGRVH